MNLPKLKKYPIKKMWILFLVIFAIALSLPNCSSVKEYADSEDGKKMIESAKEKAKDKATQEKVKEIIKEKTK